MTFLLNCLLVISSFAALHGLQKAKRDLSDLKDDPLLRSLFTSDLQEKRKDRSISLQDEQETNQKSKGSIAYPNFNVFNNNGLQKVDERRSVNPAQELYSNGPLISNSLPVLNAQASSQPSPGYSVTPAVNPALVAANFMPLPQGNLNNQVAKKSVVPSDSVAPESSYPLQLRIHSPNAAIQGVAPHFEEFGETVESVLKAEKSQKRFFIPKPLMYDSQIFKKNSIPQPDSPHQKKQKKSKITKAKTSKKSKISKSTKENRRQYIPQMLPQQQSYMYNNPVYMNNLQGNGLFAQAQGATMQFQAPQQQSQISSQSKVASQVQNLDGAITRPIVSGEECSDQYAQCGDFAKNDYCTKFRPQMEVQCRKSCKFCVEPAAPATSAAQRSDDASGDAELEDASGSGESVSSVANKTVDETGSKRHDVLQERGNVPVTVDSDVESGSGDSDSGSGESGSGEVTETTEPEFTLPSKKASINSELEESDDSDSGSGSGDESGDAETNEPTVKNVKENPSTPKVSKSQPAKTKRTRIPRPVFAGAYPRIDLKAIASALAHYEEAALELAGEYPKPQDLDVTEYTRSFIPHPENPEDVRENRNRQNIQIAKIITAERARKSNIPKFLRVASDVKKPDVKVTDADSIDEVQRRFEVPGVEPTLNDYYAETGRLNPFERKTKKNFKKSNIENLKWRNKNFDPYEYLRNMPAGASMEPIIDPSKRSEIPSDHSYPVFLMKVSPADEKKYVEEPADRRGKIRHYDDEGIQVSEERLKEIQREKIARFEADTLASVPLSAVTQKSHTPVVQAPPLNVNAARRDQMPQQPLVLQPQQQQQVAQASFVAPAPVPVQQLQPNRYASTFGEQQQQQQQSGINRASLFPNAEPLPFGQQPGETSLRGKMLSAFFDVKSNSNPEEGSGAGSGDNGEVVGSNDATNLQSLLSTQEPDTYKQSIAENKDTIPSQQKINRMFSFNEKKDTISSPQDTSNYLRSNLAQLTPEKNIYNNYQSALNAQMSGAQFAMNFMPKTQETSWIRPNAQSELASAMPVLSQNHPDVTPPVSSYVQAQSEEASNFPTSFNEPKLNAPVSSYNQLQAESASNIAFRGKNQQPETGNDFPTLWTKSEISKPVHTSSGVGTPLMTVMKKKENIPQENLLSSAEQASIIEYFRHQGAFHKTHLPQHVETKSIIPNKPFANSARKQTVSKKTFIPSNVPALKSIVPETVDDFFNVGTNIAPKSDIHIVEPGTKNSFWTPNSNHPIEVSDAVFPKSILPSVNNIIKSNTILNKTRNIDSLMSSSWKQYSPISSEIVQSANELSRLIPNPSVSKQQASLTSNEQASLSSNQQANSFSADIGNAKYDVSKFNIPKPQVLKLNVASNEGHTSSPPVEVHPLSSVPSVKKTTNNYDTEIVKKNLIKQKPELDCGEGWRGAEGDFGTFCYKDTNMQATYEDAYSHCRRLKGNLFSVLNAYENRYLQDNVRNDFWIGYRDKGMNGNWNWTDGSRSTYTNWGKENDKPRHDCVYLNSSEGKWRDENCTKPMSFLCKMKTESCPESPEKWDFLQMRDTNSVSGCYRLFNNSMSWDDAEQLCRSKGAQIASITSESEQTIIYQHFSSKSFWIGFNDRENEGDWQWADHVTSSYTNWALDAPDNGGLSCASMVEGGKWHDDNCNKKLNVVCKKRGPKPEKTDGFNDDGVLLPVARLLKNEETAPSHLYDNLEKDGSAAVVPIFYWPLLKNSKLGMAGNHPMAVNGDARSIAGGVQLDGQQSFLDAGDFHGKCIGDPDRCSKGFSVGLQVKFNDAVKQYKKSHYVVDTAGDGKGFSIYIADGQLHYKVVSKDGTWEKATDVTTSRWQDIVMTWNKAKGLQIYVNGAIKDSQSKSISSEISSTSSSQMLIGRQNSKGTSSESTKMVIASVAMFSKQLSIEDVPYAFTYGNTVVASYRWLMNDIQNSEIPGAPEIEKRKDITDIDGGIFIDGSVGWLQIDDFPNVIHNVQKATYGFSISFKLKFDQRVREYKEPRYVLDTGGHVNGVNGISVYLVNDNMYFQVIRSTSEDVMTWRVRTPIYTVRWQQIVMTWRLDKGLWIYLDGMYRGHTLTPEVLPEEVTDVPKRFCIGRKNKGPDFDGAVFGFSSLAIYGRYLKRTETEKVFGNTDNPFQGIIREVWRKVEGDSLQELKANVDFPNNPTTIEIIQNFDAPFNVDKNYGSKLKGYFIAPETGNSTFQISCSRACELYFSEDEEGKTKEKIIRLNQSTEHNVWNKYENQSSREIFLVAGKYYYLEAIQKGVDSSDSLSVGVQLPTGRYQRPINKENLQWRLPGNPHAGLVRDVWYNVPGYTVNDLTSDPNYPHRPSSTEVLDKFDAPFNVDDNYGSRISGYFHAPETGEFRFYLAADSTGEFWLSKDESEANLQKIITLNGWTDHNEWTKYSDQKSDKIFLVAGQYYYVRVYMKADKLGDCASVAVELPSGRFEGPIKKKHLSWKLVGSKEGPGPKEVIDPLPKAVGLFPLNDASMKSMFAGDDGNRIQLSDVELTTGPRDEKDEAISFKGNSTSFIEIPNNGSLDTTKSITILANIYPTGDNGPIVNYNPSGWGVHLWQFSKSQLFVRFVTRTGGMMTQPLATRVLQLDTWNQVGATYDRNTGVAQLWHDGKMVKSRNIGQIELATNSAIRLGARQGDDRYFEGKISCVQIYDRALNEEEIGELRNCPSTHKNADVDVTNSSTKVADNAENRIGDDTEEELIATRCDINPCKNNGICKDDDKKIDGYVCLCPDEYTGRRCQVSRSAAENPVVKRTNIPSPVNTTSDIRLDTLTNQTASNSTSSQSGVNATSSDQSVNETQIPANNSSLNQANNTALNQSVTNATVDPASVGTNQQLNNLLGNLTTSNGIENNTFTSNDTVVKSDESKEDISLLYQKLGCFKDDPSNHDLKTKIDLKRTTQEDCAKACAMKDKSFSYFGLQNGSSCFCGNDHGKYGKLADNACNITCDGNEAENCGGQDANNVFFYGLGTSYTVKTFTGKEFGAGTDAKIYFELIGERGTSDFRQLDASASKYEPGSVDTQSFLLPDLGKLKRMKILHDNTGTAPSWYLDKVQVTDEEGGKYEFLCDDWLSDTKSGGKLERELVARSIVPRIT